MKHHALISTHKYHNVSEMAELLTLSGILVKYCQQFNISTVAVSVSFRITKNFFREPGLVLIDGEIVGGLTEGESLCKVCLCLQKCD